jgi:hypothetical protein
MLQQFDTIVFCIFLPHIFDVIELNFNKCAFHAKTWWPATSWSHLLLKEFNKSFDLFESIRHRFVKGKGQSLPIEPPEFYRNSGGPGSNIYCVAANVLLAGCRMKRFLARSQCHLLLSFLTLSRYPSLSGDWYKTHCDTFIYFRCRFDQAQPATSNTQAASLVLGYTWCKMLTKW